MTAIEDAWVEKAARLLAAEDDLDPDQPMAWQSGEEDMPAWSDYAGRARIVIAAVADDIRAQERERIAQAIEGLDRQYGLTREHLNTIAAAAHVARAEEVA